MSQFVFTTKEAAIAAPKVSERTRVYEVTKSSEGDQEAITRYVLATSQEVAKSRFADFLGVTVVGGKSRGAKGSGGPSKKDLEAAIKRVTEATPDTFAQAQAELKRIREQIEASKAKREAAKAAKASGAASSAPSPPATPVAPNPPAPPAPVA